MKFCLSLNGERDNTENLINNFITQNPKINIKVIESEPGATIARNKGIEELNREYVTFKIGSAHV